MSRQCLMIAFLMFGLGPVAAWAQTPETTTQTGTADKPQSAEDIRACARANLPDRTMAQTVRLRAVDRAGSERRIDAKIYIKRFEGQESRATLKVTGPTDIRGTSYLLIDNAGNDRMFLYLPSLQRVRRISGRTAAGSMLSTDFSYEDMKQLRGMSAGGQLRRLDDAEFRGRAVYMVELTPPVTDDSGYRRIVFSVDKQTCVPLQVAFYATGEQPRKRMIADVDSLTRLGDRWLAKTLIMRDLRDGTHTVMRLLEVEYDEGISDSIFNQRTFYLGLYLPDTRPLPG